VAWVDEGYLRTAQRKPVGDEKKTLARPGYAYIYPVELGRWIDGEDWRELQVFLDPRQILTYSEQRTVVDSCQELDGRRGLCVISSNCMSHELCVFIDLNAPLL
jgi:hypothetical protein